MVPASLVLVAIALLALACSGENPQPDGRSSSSPIEEVCDYSRATEPVIKGNISFTTGEKIYHVPNGEFYKATVINESKGERWFCTEAEARAAGWRKSQR